MLASRCIQRLHLKSYTSLLYSRRKQYVSSWMTLYFQCNFGRDCEVLQEVCHPWSWQLMGIQFCLYIFSPSPVNINEKAIKCCFTSLSKGGKMKNIWENAAVTDWGGGGRRVAMWTLCAPAIMWMTAYGDVLMERAHVCSWFYSWDWHVLRNIYG